jgi:hypothetical protein
MYHLSLCMYCIPIIGRTIIPNPQSPNQIGLDAKCSTRVSIIQPPINEKCYA